MTFNHIHVYKVRTIHNPYFIRVTRFTMIIPHHVTCTKSVLCYILYNLLNIQGHLSRDTSSLLTTVRFCRGRCISVHLVDFNGWMAQGHVTHGSLQPGRLAKQLRAKLLGGSPVIRRWRAFCCRSRVLTMPRNGN